MAITVNCTQCGTTVAAPDSAAGKKGRCTVCGEIMDIPVPAAPRPPEANPGVRVVEENLGLQEASIGTRERPGAVQNSGRSSPARNSLDELLQDSPNRAPRARTSCGTILLIFFLVGGLMLAGGGALFYFVAWPAMIRARGVVQDAAAIGIMKRLAMSQQVYFARNGEYARRISGPNSLGSASLITPLEANAEAPPGPNQPYLGLCFKILTRQGTRSVKNYIDAQGRMTGGFAILAYNPGNDAVVKAYLCGTDGIVYEKTFDRSSGQGPEVSQSYDPQGWVPAGSSPVQTQKRQPQN